jgi:aryl-alcohol dehydrogenase-like predicted oxidoreductase
MEKLHEFYLTLSLIVLQYRKILAPKGDFRRRYFAGDRLDRAVARVEAIKKEIEGTNLIMPQLALKYTLMHPAVSTVIAGIRNVQQAEMNTAVSDLPNLADDLMIRLRKHAWLRAFWYDGK